MIRSNSFQGLGKETGKFGGTRIHPGPDLFLGSYSCGLNGATRFPFVGEGAKKRPEPSRIRKSHVLLAEDGERKNLYEGYGDEQWREEDEGRRRVVAVEHAGKIFVSPQESIHA